MFQPLNQAPTLCMFYKLVLTHVDGLRACEYKCFLKLLLVISVVKLNQLLLVTLSAFTYKVKTSVSGSNLTTY